MERLISPRIHITSDYNQYRKSASKQAIAVPIKLRFTFTSF